VTKPDVRTIGRHETVAIHHGNAVTGECPFWDAGSGMLWWVDIQGQRLLGCSPGSGDTVEYPFDPSDGLGERIVAVESDVTTTRINEGKPDPAGRLWFGTMDKSGSGAPVGSLYRLDLDGRLDRIRTEIRIPNAIDFSTDGSRFFFCDTRSRTIEVAAYDPASGLAGPARPFVQFPETGAPDGSCIDAEGGLWVALIEAGRIERFRPDGMLDLVVELPVSRPTMPTLGGPDGRTLFVTSQRRVLSAQELARQPLAGDLLAIRVPYSARPPFLAAF
jgi:sugar lactone lactonase YvrE